MFFGVSDYRDCVPANSGALRHRRKDVSSDGADCDACPRRIAGPGVNVDAGALLICSSRQNRGTRQLHHPCSQDCVCADRKIGVAIAVVDCARSRSAICTAIFIFRHLGADFIPKLDEGTFTMMVFRSSSISIEQSIEQQRKTEEEIQKRVPEITHVFSRIGSAEIATDPMPPSDCDFYVYYKPQSEWRKIDNRPISKEDLAKIIATELEALNPGARIMVAQPVEMRFNEMLEGIRADIAVKIFGEDYDVLERLGSEVKEILEQIPGTREGEGEVEYETTGRSPMMEIRVKRDVLAKYNVHAGEVNQTIATALAGQTVGTMIEENHRFDIVLRLAEADRENVDAIRALPVRVGELGLLPLGDVADIERVQTVSPILRDSAQRRAALMVNLRGRDVESWVREADAKVREH